jgi:hypothetical protein
MSHLTIADIERDHPKFRVEEPTSVLDSLGLLVNRVIAYGVPFTIHYVRKFDVEARLVTGPVGRGYTIADALAALLLELEGRDTLLAS